MIFFYFYFVLSLDKTLEQVLKFENNKNNNNNVLIEINAHHTEK